ncbi:MAG TPA: ABC transporter ATP-binding protein [Gaiellaceae bacterium]|nr:ABC transporter ATP-binding protein [Gaiellaceae bacterium]
MSVSGTPVLELRGVHTYYGESHILHGVDLSVSSGQVVALLGRNGVGKTTTVRSIVGFTPPRSGKVVFKGKDIAGLPAQRIARMGISLVPQGRRVFGSLTVREHLKIFGANGGTNGWDLDRVVSIFPRLGDRLKQRAGGLSGGEQQMLAIGRALITNPDLLVMDEITEGLSPVMVEATVNVIRNLKETEGQTILLVEQNLPMALGLADYVYVMNKGAIVFEGLAEKLESAHDVHALYLGV